MKRHAHHLIAIAVVVVLLSATWVLYAVGRLDSVGEFVLGCRFASVDETEFVADNRELLDEIPKFPGSVLVYERSSGAAVAQDRCLPFENSGPYDSYATYERYEMPPNVKFLPVVLFYRDELKSRGWTLSQLSGTNGRNRGYKRGEATVLVERVGEHFFELVVLSRYRAR